VIKFYQNVFKTNPQRLPQDHPVDPPLGPVVQSNLETIGCSTEGN
jgi:hypothetical protein